MSDDEINRRFQKLSQQQQQQLPNDQELASRLSLLMGKKALSTIPAVSLDRAFTVSDEETLLLDELAKDPDLLCDLDIVYKASGSLTSRKYVDFTDLVLASPTKTAIGDNDDASANDLITQIQEELELENIHGIDGPIDDSFNHLEERMKKLSAKDDPPSKRKEPNVKGEIKICLGTAPIAPSKEEFLDTSHAWCCMLLILTKLGICNEDAVRTCLECDNDSYCLECFNQEHHLASHSD